MNERVEQLLKSRRATILPTDRRRVEVYTAYFDQIDSQEICPSLKSAIDYWGEIFIDGNATQEQLDEAAKHVLAVNAALKSLPAKLRGEIEVQLGDYHRVDKIGVILMDPDYFPQMPTIVELVTAGIPPQDRFIQLLDKESDKLPAICGFGKALIPLSEEGLYPLVSITEDIIMETLTGYIDPESLPQIARYIEELYRKGYPFLQSLDPKKNAFLWFYNLCTSSKMRQYGPAAATLLGQGIFPAPALAHFLKENPDGLAYLKELQEATAAGKFDPQDTLQRELEYTKYLQILKPSPASPEIPRFSSLDFIYPETSELTKTEQIEAEIAALEAAKLYWFVKQRIEAGRKVAVIGNERYGWLFAVEPLRGMLESLGARVGKCRVSSGINHEETPSLPRLADFIATERPDDIIIVDGTQTPQDRGRTRFPYAMIGFVNWFAKNAPDFEVAHWVPYIAPQTAVENGGDPKSRFIHPNSQGRCFILANPVHPQNSPDLPIELRSHQPAYYDDPDDKTNARARIAFTPHGLQKLYSDKTEEDLVAAVQQHMGLVLEEMIEKTNPSRTF